MGSNTPNLETIGNWFNNFAGEADEFIVSRPKENMNIDDIVEAFLEKVREQPWPINT